MSLELNPGDPVAVDLVGAIRDGDVDALERMLAVNPELATAGIRGRRGGFRTPLHVVADWPGFFPNGPAIAAVLLRAGGDPNAGAPGETPLHWAASSDDVEVARALIDGGADIEAMGASIGGGTPLYDAVGYGCWHVARLLLERGARVHTLWQAAGLGLLPRVEEFLAGDPPPSRQDLDDAFCQACHGGQRRMAERLLRAGADINGTPSWGDTLPLDSARGMEQQREALVNWLRERGARSADDGDSANS